MPVVIIAYGPSKPSLVGDPAWSVFGEYVKTYDPAAHHGCGEATFTNDPAEALTFATFAEANAFAFQVPAERPLRADGLPNRPLTAFTLEFKEAP